MKTNNKTRRFVMMSFLGIAGLYASPVFAFKKSDAEKLIKNLTNDVLGAVNEQKSEDIMLSRFEEIFSKYADVPLIARKALGPTWRGASKAQRSAYVSAFRGVSGAGPRQRRSATAAWRPQGIRPGWLANPPPAPGNSRRW